MPDLLRIRPFQSLWAAVSRYFRDPRLRQLFARYSTYVGSSPFEAPATTMLIAHAEQEGVWTVDGGMHKVAEAIIGLETPNLTGGVAKMLPNHHLTKPVLIGEVRADGQFDVVWKTDGTVPGDAWTDFLPASKDVIADWTGATTGGKPCGNYNTKTKECSGTIIPPPK